MFNLFKKRSKTDLNTEPENEISQTKRLFFKGVATAGVAFAAVSGWKKDGWMHPKKKGNTNFQKAYDQDVLPGDKVLQQNGFEEVSKEETEAMVQMFIDDYEQNKQV